MGKFLDTKIQTAISSEIDTVSNRVEGLESNTDLLLTYQVYRINADRRKKLLSIVKAAEQKRKYRKECKRREQIARRREIRKRSGRV